MDLLLDIGALLFVAIVIAYFIGDIFLAIYTPELDKWWVSLIIAVIVFSFLAFIELEGPKYLFQ